MKTNGTHIVFMILFLSSFSSAETIPANEKTDLRYTAGVNIESDQVFPPCVEAVDLKHLAFEGVPMAEGETLSQDGTLRIKTSVVTDYSELSEYQNESLAGEAKFFSFNGSAAKYSEHQKLKLKHQVTIGIKAQRVFGRRFIETPKIKVEYKPRSSSPKDIQDFYDQCGHEFISGFTLGQGISILLTSNNETSASYAKVVEQVNLAISKNSNSADLNTRSLNIAKELLKFGSLQIEIYAYGAGGFEPYANLIKTDLDLKDLFAEITKILSSMDKSKAVITQYLTQPYPIRNQPYRTFEKHFIRNTLINLFNSYLVLNESYDGLRSASYIDYSKIYPDLCNLENSMSCEDYLNSILKKIELYDKAISATRKMITKCGKTTSFDDCQFANELPAIESLVKANILWPKQYLAILRNTRFKNELRNRLEFPAENEP